MPVYDYKCRKHGVFFELATIEDRDKPCACPSCGELASRIIRLAPEVLAMAPEKRMAHEKNERSQHEPAFSSAERREQDEYHARGCACQKKLGDSKLFYTAQGDKMFPSMRPWMISH